MSQAMPLSTPAMNAQAAAGARFGSTRFISSASRSAYMGEGLVYRGNSPALGNRCRRFALQCSAGDAAKDAAHAHDKRAKRGTGSRRRDWPDRISFYGKAGVLAAAITFAGARGAYADAKAPPKPSEAATSRSIGGPAVIDKVEHKEPLPVLDKVMSGIRMKAKKDSLKSGDRYLGAPDHPPGYNPSMDPTPSLKWDTESSQSFKGRLSKEGKPNDDYSGVKWLPSTHNKWLGGLTLYKEMSYTDLWVLVRERHVATVKFSMDNRYAYVWTKYSAPLGAKKYRVGVPFDPRLPDHLTMNGVKVENEEPSSALQEMLMLYFSVFIPALLTWKFFGYLNRFNVNSVENELEKAASQPFGDDSSSLTKVYETDTTLDDVAGLEGIRDEVLQIIQFLKTPEVFKAVGAKIPAGCLMVGPPGTGKTILAKAIAGESGVPFLYVSGSSFTEMYVGTGAGRVRDLFKKGRQMAPALIFIDEFDAVGKKREMSSGGNEEHAVTINQLLVEMDGFDANAGLIVLAATNRPAVLDPALTRSGRFDRVLHLSRPSMSGRIEILKVHGKDKKIADDLNWNTLGRATSGFTGAELMNLMNEAAVHALKLRAPLITTDMALEVLEKTTRERDSGIRDYEGKSAIHVPYQIRTSIIISEAGKVLTAMLHDGYDELTAVSLFPAGEAVAFSYFVPNEGQMETGAYSKAYIEARLCVAVAGRCAERLMMGHDHITTGNVGDLSEANSIARQMVYRFGMGRRIGPISLTGYSSDHMNLSGAGLPIQSALSTSMSEVAINEVQDLLDAAEAKVYYGLCKNYHVFRKMCKEFLGKYEWRGEEILEMVMESKPSLFSDLPLIGYRFGEDGQLYGPWVDKDEEYTMGEGREFTQDDPLGLGKHPAADNLGVQLMYPFGIEVPEGKDWRQARTIPITSMDPRPVGEVMPRVGPRPEGTVITGYMPKAEEGMLGVGPKALEEIFGPQAGVEDSARAPPSASGARTEGGGAGGGGGGGAAGAEEGGGGGGGGEEGGAGGGADGDGEGGGQQGPSGSEE